MMNRRGKRTGVKTDLAGGGPQTLPLAISGYRGVFDRRLADEPSMLEFVRTADTLMQEGQVLKEDGASFVSRVLWNGQDVVVKRYNHRGLWHSLRHTLKRSRARRNWQKAHRLAHLRIATPEPLAYVDQYCGPLLWQSYFITRFVPGPQVREILRDKMVADSQKQQINGRVWGLLRLMAEHGISHGDMKHTNILYDGTDVVLTDLDAMRIGGLNRLWRRRCRRDAERYLRELSDLRTTSTRSRGP
jgi:tRNA A-37 threonylcarbamoyl transferase component Bud32